MDSPRHEEALRTQAHADEPGRGRHALAAAGGVVVMAIVAALLLALDVGAIRSRLVGPAATPAGRSCAG